jgi:hypothetical protein
MFRNHKLATVLAATALAGGGFSIAEAAKSGNSGTTQQQRAGGKQRGGPIPTSALKAIAETLGVSTADLRTALEANKPERPESGRPPGCEEMAAEIAEKLGVETSAVQEIMEANRPARPSGRPSRSGPPPKPDHTALIAALAEGLDIDQSTVQTAFDELEAAHEADHEAREQALYDAVAEALGKTPDEVKAAFEANRPAKRN